MNTYDLYKTGIIEILDQIDQGIITILDIHNLNINLERIADSEFVSYAKLQEAIVANYVGGTRTKAETLRDLLWMWYGEDQYYKMLGKTQVYTQMLYMESEEQ